MQSSISIMSEMLTYTRISEHPENLVSSKVFLIELHFLY